MVIDYTHVVSSGDPIVTPEFDYSRERFEGFKALAAAGKANGSLIIAQLNHPRRQVRDVYSKEAISASAVPLGTSIPSKFITPRSSN